MLKRPARFVAALGAAAAIAATLAAPAGATVSTTPGTGYSRAAVTPLDHNLRWIAWDDTIFSSYSKCMNRGAYLAQVYTDIVAYRCLNRWTVNVQPPKYGIMLEVQRP
jgi:hypothetical protein